MIFANCSAFPVARKSMGFETDEPGKSLESSSRALSPFISGVLISFAERVSVSITAGPPA